MRPFDRSEWALILGGSSGFGLATAIKLAHNGMSIAVVHRDRKGAMAAIEPEFQAIRETGARFLSFNLDALSPEGRKTVLDALAAEMGQGRIRMLMHSIAFGNLKLLVPPRDAAAARAAGYDTDAFLEEEDFARTIHAMGTSIAVWVQDVLARGLFAADARVIGMTSEGNEVAWRGYAAVAAAKVALESVCRAMAVELAPYGIRSNVVQAGVTDTPALRLIPGSARMKEEAIARNPFGRLTTPDDVADVIYLLCTDEARWINGTIVRVDGGEHIAG
jgi:NAD(P)-dependent dehydrogenase (short-subunit alcohol dehydrogenase family)